MNVILLLGAVLGLSSIMMAAYVDHSFAVLERQVFKRVVDSGTIPSALCHSCLHDWFSFDIAK